MLSFSGPTPSEQRVTFRQALDSGRLLQLPGAISPLSALAAEAAGFDGHYVSGAVVSNDLGFPDLSLVTLTEVAQRVAQVCRVADHPVVVDVDTGFGEELNAFRTVRSIEEAGAAACQIEDQQNPKRCGHLDGKNVVNLEHATSRLRAAVEARRDPNFLICARTDARAVEGLDSAIARARAYVEAGADMIFPEALADRSEFEVFRQAIDIPLLANMTEFGKSSLLTAGELGELGYNVVIYPVTLQRVAFGAIERALATIREKGTQESLLDQMQTRARLYELIDYATAADYVP